MDSKNYLKKIIYLAVCFTMFFQQVGFAQGAAELNIAGYLAGMHSSIAIDKFRPLHLRYFSYDSKQDNFRFLFDKGDTANSTNSTIATNATKELVKYFLIGIILPDSKFWVNLRPDSENQIIEPELAQTDLGKVLLEADLQLKKDTAKYTSPETPEGRQYWNKLYKKAEELFGNQPANIPTLTRPWIVPGEIIVRETQDSSFIYKSTLKVMLEEDYLKSAGCLVQGASDYQFKDERAKMLNEYSTQLIRELVIPKLTKEVNTSKKYAALRQVFYSLILSRWFKARFANATNSTIATNAAKTPFYVGLINSGNLNGLTSKESWSKTAYFEQYKKSFSDGEYNIKEPVYTPTGQVIRSYFSGGINVDGQMLPAQNLLGFSGDNPIALAANSNLITAVSGSPLGEAVLPELREVGVNQSAAPSTKERILTRRQFLKITGIVGAGLAVVPKIAAVAMTKQPIVQIQQASIDSVFRTLSAIFATVGGRTATIPALSKALQEEGFSSVVGTERVILNLDGTISVGVFSIFRDGVYYYNLPYSFSVPDDLLSAMKNFGAPIIIDEASYLNSEKSEEAHSDFMFFMQNFGRIISFFNDMANRGIRETISVELPKGQLVYNDVSGHSARIYSAPRRGQYINKPNPAPQYKKAIVFFAGNPNYQPYWHPSIPCYKVQGDHFIRISPQSSGSPAVTPSPAAAAQGSEGKAGSPAVSIDWNSDFNYLTINKNKQYTKKDGTPLSRDEAEALLRKHIEERLASDLEWIVSEMSIRLSVKAGSYEAPITKSLPTGILCDGNELNSLYLRLEKQTDSKILLGGVFRTTEELTMSMGFFNVEVSAASSGIQDAGSPTMQAVTHPGGIDFRVMNIVSSPLIASSSLKLAPQELVELAKINIDELLWQIQGMLAAGTVPAESLKQYVVACRLNGEWDERSATANSCLVETCRLLEDNVMETPQPVKEALIIADAERLGI